MKAHHRLLAILLVLIFVCTPLLTPDALAAEPRDGYLTLEEAGEYVRKELAAQKTDVTVKFYFDSPYAYSEGELWELLKAEVMKHTGVPDEGDYLYWSFQQVAYGTSEYVAGQTHYVTFKYIKPTYNASKEQEQELDAKLAEVMASLELESKTDYEKVEAICLYICEHVKYSQDVVADQMGEYEGSAEDLNVFYSAYGALVLGEATCQGYGSLVYRMMLEAGIDCRLIAGDQHGWNIVKLGDLYYYLDMTGSNVLWESEGIIDEFLCGSASFRSYPHRAWTSQFNREFLDQYPISVLDYDQIDLSQQPADTIIGSGQLGPSVYWQLTAGGKLTVSGQGDMYNKALNDHQHGHWGHWGDLNGYIRFVEIEEGVTSIGDYAFFSCPALEEITIADSVTYIGSNAFAQCENLKQITIGNNVTCAGECAFDRCARLESVSIGSGLKRIPGGMFTGCTDLTIVQLAEGIEVIGESAFSNCPSLVSINIPASVTTLEFGAFAESFDPEAKLSFTVPETVTQVGFACFELSGLREIIWNAQTDTLEYDMFNLSFYLEKVTLSNSIRNFEKRVFCDCRNLKSVNIPVQLDTLGENAFQWCISLEQITLPDSLTAIYGNAFVGCKKLKQLVIPASVTEIGRGAFDECPYLVLVYLGDAPDGNAVPKPPADCPREGSCGENTRWILSDEGVLTISGNGKIADNLETAEWQQIKPYVKKVIIEEGVTRIGRWAFLNSYNLTEATIPGSVTEICEDAFGGTSLETVIFLGDAPTIEAYAFSDANSFTVYYPRESSGYTQALRSRVGNGAKSWKAMHPASEDHTLQAKAYDQDRHSISCTSCPEIFELEVHSYSNACDNTCDTCGNKRSVSHNCGETWLQDDIRHWQECADCGATANLWVHIFDNGVSQNGTIVYTCKDCGYTKTKVEPTSPSTQPTDPSVPATQPTDPSVPATQPSTPELDGSDNSNDNNGGNFLIPIIVTVVVVLGGAGIALVLKKRK